MTTIPVSTYSHIVKAQDNRCMHWQRILTDVPTILLADLAQVGDASTLPGAYARKGSDHELPAWSVVFDGEAVHHVKNRGWVHTLGVTYPLSNGQIGIVWVRCTPEHKAAIKASGAGLMAGSGPNAAMLRVAQYVLGGIGDQERIDRLHAMDAIT